MIQKLLLVEDEALIAMHERSLLEKAGFGVEHSYTGEDAIEKTINDNEISLVLMDIDLGSGIDGTKAARIILEKRSL